MPVDTIPSSLPAHVVIAAPHDGSPPILLATTSQQALNEHLRRAGVDPAACAFGTARLAHADFPIDWDRNVHIEAGLG